MIKHIPFIKDPKRDLDYYTNITQKENLRQRLSLGLNSVKNIKSKKKDKKGLVHLEDITIINLYVCNKRTLNYMKQKLTIEEKTSNSVVVGDFNTPILGICRTIGRVINKEIKELNTL